MKEKENNSGDAILDYFMALRRLVSNSPKIVPRGELISLKSVSLEAGRKGDSIKRGRPQFALLIEEIDREAAAQAAPKKAEKKKRDDNLEKVRQLMNERDGAVSREISLLWEVYNLKKRIAEITGENVFPLRPKHQDADSRNA